MTCANSNRTMSLMTLTVNMSDVYHTTQHLVFVFFDAGKWLLAEAKCLCCFSCLWNEEINGGCAASCDVFPSHERTLNSVVILLPGSICERWRCFAHCDEPIHSVLSVYCKESPGMPEQLL